MRSSCLSGAAPIMCATSSQKYLKALIAAGPATYVVFVDATTKQFVGSASGRQVLAALSDPAVAGALHA